MNNTKTVNNNANMPNGQVPSGYPKQNMQFKCSLIIANQIYFGDGETKQMAKQDAAVKALQYWAKFNSPSSFNKTRKWHEKDNNNSAEKSKIRVFYVKRLFSFN